MVISSVQPHFLLVKLNTKYECFIDIIYCYNINILDFTKAIKLTLAEATTSVHIISEIPQSQQHQRH